jgi:mRNA interferase MazF
VVLLSGGPEFEAVRIVAPATAVQKQGFVILSGAQAVSGVIAAADGIEVGFGAAEGLAEDGVVRVALPRDGAIFCTWALTLTAADLIERAGVLSPVKLRELDVAMQLSRPAA